jgi:enamine deaminase RidA (YjgF/YER057c/UK114 family)
MRESVAQITLVARHCRQQGDNHMRSQKFAFLALALCAFAAPASAQNVTRLPLANPTVPIVSAVTVPAGYTTHYISGIPGGPKNPNAPEGSADRWGDTAQQTDDVLNKLEAVLKQLGLNFGDVVKATVFLVADPHNGGKINFPAMNAEWSKRFGTADPAQQAGPLHRSGGPGHTGPLVEIELVAVKK